MMRPDLEIEMIEALQFYARPVTHEVNVDDQRPSEIFLDQGAKARAVLERLGIVEH